MKKVDARIDYFTNNFTANNKQSYSLSRIKYKLKELSKQFVFVPADKAANNIIIV